jgi:hypothetical protein
MRNYALQKGPCNFLNLRTSPWEIPFLLLLCFSSLSLLPLPSVSFPPAALLLGSSPCLPSSARLQDRRRKRERSGVARALGSGGAGAGERVARAGVAPGGVERGVGWPRRRAWAAAACGTRGSWQRWSAVQHRSEARSGRSTGGVRAQGGRRRARAETSGWRRRRCGRAQAQLQELARGREEVGQRGGREQPQHTTLAALERARVRVQRLRADPHGSSGAARGGCRRPSRRRQWKARP